MSSAPFIGLRPFKKDESKIFFGRDFHTVDVMEKLAEHHFVTVAGYAGSGKTSLINAGILPALVDGALVRPGNHWQIAEMQAGADPFKALVKALGFEQALDASLHALSFDENTLKESPDSLHALLQEHPLPRNNKLLIVCDQFEDLFRYDVPEEELNAFIKFLVTCASPYRNADGDVLYDAYVLIGLRSEYLQQCQLLSELAGIMHKGLFLLPSLSPEQINDVIGMPALMFGGAFDAELSEQIVKDVHHNPYQLPLLQFTLNEMWAKSNDKKLSIFDYFVLGGIKNVMANQCEILFQQLPLDQQRVASQAIKALMQPTVHGKLAFRPLTLATLATRVNVDLKTVVRALDVFRGEKDGFVLPKLPQLLTKDSELDIAYDSCVEQWHRVQDWLLEESNSLANYQKLSEAASLHQAKKGALLSSAEVEIFWPWFQDEQNIQAVSKRYGKQFDSVAQYLKKSKRMARLKKTGLVAASLASLFVTSLITNHLLSSAAGDKLALAPSAPVQSPVVVTTPVQPTLALGLTEDLSLKVPVVTPTPQSLPPDNAEMITATQNVLKVPSIELLYQQLSDKRQLIKVLKDLGIKDAEQWRLVGDQFRRQLKQKSTAKDSKMLAKAANQMYQQALSVDQEDAKTWLSLGQLYRFKALNKERFDNRTANINMAITALEKATRLNADDEEGFYLLGTLYQLTKNPERAIAQFKQQLSVKPDHRLARKMLNELEQKQNKFKEEMAIYEQALKLNPKNYSAKRRLLNLLKHQSQQVAWLSEEEDILSIAPDLTVGE